MKGETWESQALMIHFRYLSVVPVSRNRYKTVSKLYENFNIKVVGLNRSYSANKKINLKTIISHRNLRLSGLLPLYLFCILIDIIDNIHMYICPYYFSRTPPMPVQYTAHVIQAEITWPVYCPAIGWWRHTDYM